MLCFLGSKNSPNRRHPKWKEASIAAVIPGWQRFKVAQDWLDRWREQHLGALSNFKNFMERQGHANLSQEELETLYGRGHMLKSVIICTAIATFAIIPTAKAQVTTPFPGPGALYANGTIQGGRSYSDWQQTRRDHGLDYDQNALQRPRDTYQPYPSFGSRSHNYGDDN
jgi:hypothetical protein